MWANLQRDGRPAEYVERRRCSNEAKTRNRLKFAGVPQTNESISAASGPKFTILWGHVGQSREWVDGSWVMGQMGHENRIGHMGHGSLGVDPRPISFWLYGWAYILWQW